MERDLYTRKDQFGVEIRERAKWDIRDAMVGAETFKPKHIVIATWKNVSFAGGIPSATRIVSLLCGATSNKLKVAIFYRPTLSKQLLSLMKSEPIAYSFTIGWVGRLIQKPAVTQLRAKVECQPSLDLMLETEPELTSTSHILNTCWSEI